MGNCMHKHKEHKRGWLIKNYNDNIVVFTYQLINVV